MWLVFALLAAFLFGLVIVLDSFCVDELFEKAWAGVVTSSITSLILPVSIPFIAPFVVWEAISLKALIFSFFAGCIIQCSQWLYFESLDNTESGIVAAYWNSIPIFLAILSAVFLGEILDSKTYLAILIIVASSTWLLLIDEKKEFRRKTFLLMMAASFSQAIAYLLLDSAYEETTFINSFFIMTIGLIFVGVIPLFFSEVRKETVKALKFWKILLFIEILNIAALLSAQISVKIGNPTLVATIETTIPVFTLLISILLYLSNNKFGDKRSLNKFRDKMLAIFAMAFAIFLIS